MKRRGRPPGKKNATTEMVKVAYMKLLHESIPDVKKWLKEIGKTNPELATKLLLNDLTKYILPNLQNSTTDVNITHKQVIDYSKLSNDDLKTIIQVLEKTMDKDKKDDNA